MKKISDTYFFSSLIITLILLLPVEQIYSGYSFTIIGYLFLILAFIFIPIAFLLTILVDLKSKKRRLFFTRLIVLIIIISIWYLRFYLKIFDY